MIKDKISRAASLMAKQAGNACLKKHGKKHYKKMANIRWSKVKTKKSNKK